MRYRLLQYGYLDLSPPSADSKRDPPGYKRAGQHGEWDFNQDDIHEGEAKLNVRRY